MLALLFALASLVWLVGQIHRAGGSIRRTEPRGVYWATVGIGLGLLVAGKPVIPAALTSIGVAALGGALLYGLVADWQGWWRG